MRASMLLVAACLATACTTQQDGGCEVRENADGSSTITCADGTSVTVQNGRDGQDGQDGEDGQDGTDGEDGASCTVVDNGDGTKTISCEDGTEVVVRDGTDAGGCAVEPRDDGTLLLTCEDGTSRIIPVDECDGTVSGGDFSSAGGWNTSGGAFIDPAAGVLKMGLAAVCGGGRAEQRVCVPPYEEGAGLRLKLRAGLRGCLDDSACFSNDPMQFLVGDWSAPYGASGPTGYTEYFLCLGENQYGHAFTLALQAGAPAASCPTKAEEFELDAIELESAPRGFCPPPGQIFNGSFELENGLGWTLQTHGNATAEWVFDGTDREAHLAVQAGTCDVASLTGYISIPRDPSQENLAVEITATGTAGKILDVALASRAGSWTDVTGTGTSQTIRLCVPRSEYGNALQFYVGINGYDAAARTCAGGMDFRIDDVRFVSEPDCAPVP